MVTVDFQGRTGNRLFQYVIARLVAKHSGMKLVTEWPEPNFIEVTEPDKGDEVSNSMIRVEALSSVYNHDLGKHRIHLNGYFQDAKNYNFCRDEIKGFFKLPKVEQNTKDLVIHLRLTDYWCDRVRSVINPTWYKKVLKFIDYRQLYIVVEPHVSSKKYLKIFEPYAPIYVSESPKSDFEFIRSFDKIVCSNSSFCWWAAFLGDPKQVITFGPKWMYNPGPKLSHMIGATMIEGTFIRDRQLESLNWDDYWKKDPRTYCCIKGKK